MIISTPLDYRPNCSTICALVALDHRVAQYLETFSFVRCLTNDYSKAFHTIQHPILFQKLINLDILPNIASWIFTFLTDRTQSVCLQVTMSDWKPVIQGPGIGPYLFIIYAIGLKCISSYI